MEKSLNDKSLWDEIYRKTDFHPGWDSPGLDPNLLELIKKHADFSDPEGLMLDVGCGNGRNTPLAEALSRHFGRPIRYRGVDFAESAVEHCRRSYAGKEFFLRDMCAPLEEDGFREEVGASRVIVDCGCFHAILPERRQAYKENLAALCAPGGLLVIGAWFRAPHKDGENPQYFPFLYLSEWFFNEEDIRGIWGDRFALLESRVDPAIYPGFHDGFAYFALRKR